MTAQKGIKFSSLFDITENEGLTVVKTIYPPAGSTYLHLRTINILISKMVKAEDDNAYNQSQEFWDEYIKGRPAIPQTFFDFMFDYHSKHNGQLNSVHEVGAGVGVYSSRLATRFNHVLVSDIIDTNVEIAKSRLKDQGSYSFKCSSLEATIDLPPESFDFVFASTMMHFTRVDEAIKAVHHQLKPGGTFAAGSYGTYALHDPEAQKIWAKIVLLICQMIIDRFGLNNRTERVLQQESSGLDFVGLPEEWFLPASRYKYNFLTPSTERDMILPAQYRIEPVSRIGPKDTMVMDKDPGWYSKQTIEGLKGIATTWPHDEKNPNILKLWEELDQVLQGKPVEGSWMVSLVLATKK